jgi:outer membrane lipoprotein LolB
MTARLALVGAALALTGCVHLETVDDGLGFERRQVELGAIPDWDIRGAIAVDTGERSYQSRFSWNQRGDELELDVRGRLGVGSFRIEGDGSRLAVEAQGETRILTDPERQLSEMLGWWLPVTSAEHWLLGRPDPDYPESSTRGRFDTLARLAQRDWQISYDDYQIAEGRLVPRRITLSYAPLTLALTILDFESVPGQP